MSGGRQKTTLEYLLADRGMPILPVSFSLMASFMSAVSIMGLTREIYMFGTQFLGFVAFLILIVGNHQNDLLKHCPILAINISYCLGTPIISYIFLPVFFRQQSPSVYAYLEKRWQIRITFYGSLLIIIIIIISKSNRFEWGLIEVDWPISRAFQFIKNVLL